MRRLLVLVLTLALVPAPALTYPKTKWAKGTASWTNRKPRVCGDYRVHRHRHGSRNHLHHVRDRRVPRKVKYWAAARGGLVLRCGTKIQVRRGSRRVTVAIWDRGPRKSTGRIIDLSKPAFARLRNPRHGLAKVRVQER